MNKVILYFGLYFCLIALETQAQTTFWYPQASLQKTYFENERRPYFTIPRISPPYKAEWRNSKPYKGYFVRNRYETPNNLYLIDYFEKGERVRQYSNDPFLSGNEWNYPLISTIRSGRIYEGYEYEGRIDSEGYDALFTQIWKEGELTEMWMDVRSDLYNTRICFVRSGNLIRIESLLENEKTERAELEYVYDKWLCRQYHHDTLAFVQQRGALNAPLRSARERLYLIEQGRVDVITTSYINREAMVKMSQNIISRLLIYPAVLTTPELALKDIKRALIHDSKEEEEEVGKIVMPQMLYLDGSGQWQGRYITSIDHVHYNLMEYYNNEIVKQFEHLTYEQLVKKIKELDEEYLDTGD